MPTFIRAYSQPRNYGFNTAVGTGYAMGREHDSRLHTPRPNPDGRAGGETPAARTHANREHSRCRRIPLCGGNGKVQGERLDILVSSSIEYAATSSRWNSPCSIRTGKGAFRAVLYGAGSVQRRYGEYRKRAGYKHILCAPSLGSRWLWTDRGHAARNVGYLR